MGYTWEVCVWGQWEIGEGYSYRQYYAGHSLWRAIKAMRRLREGGFKAIQLTWRPD